MKVLGPLGSGIPENRSYWTSHILSLEEQLEVSQVHRSTVDLILCSYWMVELASLKSDVSRKLYLVTPNEDLSINISSSLDHKGVEQPIL